MLKHRRTTTCSLVCERAWNGEALVYPIPIRRCCGNFVSVHYWKYGCMRACDPMLYGDMWYMASENQSCSSRWAVFEGSAIYHTFGSFVTSGTLAHKPYTEYIVLAYDWLIVQTMQPDWHRGVIRVHVSCATATLVHCCMGFVEVHALLYHCTMHDCIGNTCVLGYFYVGTALRISCMTYLLHIGVD